VNGGGRHVLTLSGELDLLAAPQLEDAVVRLAADGTTGIVLDLSNTTFIDSTGLRAILLARELTDEHGYDFWVVPGPPNVQRLFEVAALLDLLPFSAEAANPSFDGEPTASGGAPGTSG
jgi:anti-anti-sigma factor